MFLRTQTNKQTHQTNNAPKMAEWFLREQCAYTTNSTVYPPFKHGLFMEEYFMAFMCKRDGSARRDKDGRRYLPLLWLNFTIHPQYHTQLRPRLQRSLDEFVALHPCPEGYFAVIQHDDGTDLRLPPNTRVYGACTGDIKLPLIYEDQMARLSYISSSSSYSTQESHKRILCSYVGTNTHPVRQRMVDVLSAEPATSFLLLDRGSAWTPSVSAPNQTEYIEITRSSKFALAPRGYGRSSFRFFEILQMGTVPVYVWDDIEWLPYLELVDYSKFAISIHVSDLATLPQRLRDIDETQYADMRNYYHQHIRSVFGLEFMCNYITSPPDSLHLDS